MGKVLYCGMVGKVATCNASIPFGCQFLTYLVHFQFSSLLMTWIKQPKTVQVYGPPLPMWETGKKLPA